MYPITQLLRKGTCDCQTLELSDTIETARHGQLFLEQIASSTTQLHVWQSPQRVKAVHPDSETNRPSDNCASPDEQRISRLLLDSRPPDLPALAIVSLDQAVKTSSMRSLLSVAAVLLAAVANAASSSGDRLLVILEDVAEKAAYSKFFADLEGVWSPGGDESIQCRSTNTESTRTWFRYRL